MSDGENEGQRGRNRRSIRGSACAAETPSAAAVLQNHSQVTAATATASTIRAGPWPSPACEAANSSIHAHGIATVSTSDMRRRKPGPRASAFPCHLLIVAIIVDPFPSNVSDAKDLRTGESFTPDTIFPESEP